jgi:hypothetical protein
MSTESPQVGQVSADGQFSWDGEQWAPLARGHREATSWTVPLQRAAAGLLVVSALSSVVVNALFLNQAGEERATRATNPTFAADQVQSAAQLGLAITWVTIAILGVLMLVLALASLRGWRWAFWADLVVLAFASLGVLTNAFALTNPAAQPLPPAATAYGLLLSAAALSLLIWFILAATRFGPWAMKRPG